MKRWRISKEFHFSASHVLTGLADGHPCGRLHGHNYVLKVTLQGFQLDDVGFVRDYNELKPIKAFVDDVLDHRHLNEVFPDINPTVELMSERIYSLFKPFFPDLYSIEMSETPKTSCEYVSNDYH